MRVTQDLIRYNNQNNEKNRRLSEVEYQIDTYMEKPKTGFINSSDSVFKMKNEGINTAESVFDKQAVFKVRE